MLNRFSFVCALLLSCFAAADVWANPPDPSGIYVVVPMDRETTQPRPLPPALGQPFVTGANLCTNWARNEPAPGVYDWSYLDRQFTILTALGKKVSIEIEAGDRAPDWLFDLGAKPFKTVVEIPRRKEFCEPIRIPVPWDPVFLRRWDAFVAAFGRRYSGNPALTVVKVTGIAYRTDEVLLPRATGETKNGQGSGEGKTCQYPNDVENWQAIGYTSQKLDAASADILQSFKRAFPNQYLALMTGEHAFPPIGKDGRIDPAAADLPETHFWRQGRDLIGRRFVAQVNNLTDFRTEENVVAFARDGLVGYQAAWPITGDPYCYMNRGAPCDPNDVFAKAMKIATSTGAIYLEEFAADINNPDFADLFRNVQHELQNNFEQRK